MHPNYSDLNTYSPGLMRCAYCGDCYTKNSVKSYKKEEDDGCPLTLMLSIVNFYLISTRFVRRKGGGMP
jgi:hypothetical protein